MTRTAHGARRIAVAAVAFALFAGFAALGTWQVQRRAWKLALIERVEQRIRNAPVDAPGPPAWPMVGAAADEYRRVRVHGSFVHGVDTFVQAATERGAGFWVLTPLQRADGSMVLVNRGFVPPAVRASPANLAHAEGAISVTGLLRISEPGGGFLRRNDAAANRWYSRDVQAIAAARGLVRVAPYFIDADADADAAPPTPTASGTAPVGGLTIVAFHNSHLVYAITWFTLALMAVAGGWRFMREEHGGKPD